MNKFIAVIVFLVIVIISFGVFNIKETVPTSGPVFIEGKISEIPIKLEVANNPTTRSQGLSNRNDLREGEGMIFVFLESDFQGFWMKDMKFPIDIIWIDENLKIIGIEQNILPETYPTSFYPPSPVKYVIETPAGYSLKKSLKVGDPVYLESQNLNFKGTF